MRQHDKTMSEKGVCKGHVPTFYNSVCMDHWSLYISSPFHICKLLVAFHLKAGIRAMTPD